MRTIDTATRPRWYSISNSIRSSCCNPASPVQSQPQQQQQPPHPASPVQPRRLERLPDLFRRLELAHLRRRAVEDELVLAVLEPAQYLRARSRKRSLLIVQLSRVFAQLCAPRCASATRPAPCLEPSDVPGDPRLPRDDVQVENAPQADRQVEVRRGLVLQVLAREPQHAQRSHEQRTDLRGARALILANKRSTTSSAKCVKPQYPAPSPSPPRP